MLDREISLHRAMFLAGLRRPTITIPIDPKAVYERIVRLILTGGKTSPPSAARLVELRALRGRPQGRANAAPL